MTDRQTHTHRTFLLCIDHHFWATSLLLKTGFVRMGGMVSLQNQFSCAIASLKIKYQKQINFQKLVMFPWLVSALFKGWASRGVLIFIKNISSRQILPRINPSGSFNQSLNFASECFNSNNFNETKMMMMMMIYDLAPGNSDEMSFELFLRVVSTYVYNFEFGVFQKNHPRRIVFPL